MGAFDDLIPQSGDSASGGTFDDLIPKQKTSADYQREVLAEMPWAQRQLVGAGGALMKGYEGIKSMLPGQTSDKSVVEAADVAGQEAPIGSMVGEVLKYAPVALAGTATLPVAAASAALGAAYDPTGHRLSSGAMEGAFGAGGAIVGRALPKLVGRTQTLYNDIRAKFGGPPAESFYGSTDRASDALKRIVGVDNQVAASRMLGEAGDVSSAQALAGLPNAEGVAVLDKITRGEKGIAAALDPIEAANFRTEQLARQSAGRGSVMETMARGSTAEDTAIARDLFSKMSAAELVPIRDSILNKIRQTGQTLEEILPRLSTVERQYVMSLQNQGRMATESAQQGVLATGQRASDGQLIRNLPEGNFPRDPAIVQQTGAPRGAFPVDGMPRVPPRYAANVGPQAQFADAANELGGLSQGLRAEADALRKQISELPSAFTAAPVRDAVEAMAQGINGTKRTVASRIAEELRIAGDDPVKIAEVRRLGVNQLVNDLIQGGKLSQTDAAAALTEVKKLIDKQLGPEFVTRYMDPYAKKLEYRASLELADKLRELQKDSPKTFLKVMQGNDPELVAKYGDWKTIQEALGGKRYGRASEVAGEIQRDRVIEKMSKSKEHHAAVKEILENKSFTRHFPNLLNRYVVVANEAIKRGEMEVNKGMYRELEQATRTPAKMKELIDRLPPEDRSKFINYAMKLGKGAPTVAAAYGEQVRK
jgi:hypothetical protein